MGIWRGMNIQIKAEYNEQEGVKIERMFQYGQYRYQTFAQQDDHKKPVTFQYMRRMHGDVPFFPFPTDDWACHFNKYGCEPQRKLNRKRYEQRKQDD